MSRPSVASDRTDQVGDAYAFLAGRDLLGTLLREFDSGVSRANAIWAHYDELLQIVSRPGLSPELVLGLSGRVGKILAIEAMHDQIHGGVHVDAGRLDRIEKLLTAGRQSAPENLLPRVALALVRGVQNRCLEGRQLLSNVTEQSGTTEDVADAFAVRALCETDLGKHARARELLIAAERLAPDLPLFQIAQDYLARAEAAGETRDDHV